MDKQKLYLAGEIVGIISVAALSFRAGYMTHKKGSFKAALPDIIPAVGATGATIACAVAKDKKQQNTIQILEADILKRDEKALESLSKLPMSPEEVNSIRRHEEERKPMMKKRHIGRGYFATTDGRPKHFNWSPENVPDPIVVHDTGNGNHLYYEMVTKQWFRSSPSALLCAIINIKDNCVLDELSLKDYCSEFDIPCPNEFKDDISNQLIESDKIGWNWDYLCDNSCTETVLMQFDNPADTYELADGTHYGIICPELWPADLDYIYE